MYSVGLVKLSLITSHIQRRMLLFALCIPPPHPTPHPSPFCLQVFSLQFINKLYSFKFYASLLRLTIRLGFPTGKLHPAMTPLYMQSKVPLPSSHPDPRGSDRAVKQIPHEPDVENWWNTYHTGLGSWTLYSVLFFCSLVLSALIYIGKLY